MVKQNQMDDNVCDEKTSLLRREPAPEQLPSTSIAGFTGASRHVQATSPQARSMSTLPPNERCADDEFESNSESTTASSSFAHYFASADKFSPHSHPKTFHNRDPLGAQGLWKSYLGSDGVTLSFSDISIVHKNLCYPREERLVVQSCSGFFETGKLSVIVDVEKEMVAGSSLLAVLSGAALPAHGFVTGNNIPVATAKFRPAVAFIPDGYETLLFGNLTVAENISFALEMRCRGSSLSQPEIDNAEAEVLLDWVREKERNSKSCAPSWLRNMFRFEKNCHRLRAYAAASFFNLDPTLNAKDLSDAHKFLLVLAMELALDPPIMYIHTSLLSSRLDAHGLAEVSAYLKLMCSELRKTVVCLASSLPFPLFHNLDTVLLLGLEGQTLFSGDKSDMLTYFSTLGLPGDTLSSPVYDRFTPSNRRAAAGSIISSNVGSTKSFTSGDKAHHEHHSHHQQHSFTPEGQRQRAMSVPPSRGPVVPLFDPFTTHKAVNSSEEDEDTLVIDSGDAAVDLAVLWAESLPTTLRYGAVFYDSAIRKALVTKQEEYALMATATGASLANAFATSMPTATHAPSFLKYKPQGAGNQIFSLLHVFFLQSMRESEFYVSWLTLALLLGFTGWVVSAQADTQIGMMNTRGLIFLLLLVTLQINVGHVHGYVAESKVFRYQRDSGFYTTFVFVVVFFIRLVTTRIVYLATVVPFLLLLMRSSRALITLIGWLSIAHATIVYCKSILIREPKVVQFFSLMYVGYATVFSGFLVNMTSLPTVFGSLSLLRWAYSASLEELLNGRPYSCDAGNSSFWVNTTASYCYTGDQYLELEGFADDSIDGSMNIFIGVTCCTMLIITLRLWFA